MESRFHEMVHNRQSQHGFECVGVIGQRVKINLHRKWAWSPLKKIITPTLIKLCIIFM